MEEDKEFMTLDEAAHAVGIKRASLYYYIKRLKIQRHTFPLNRHAYLTHNDVERIKAVRESPWKLEERDDTDKREAIKPAA
jgi:predicted site-specific integrase-resolvase